MKNQIKLVSMAISLMLSTANYANAALTLSSPDFKDGGQLPVRFTCEGEGISPSLTWNGVPTGTQSLVVIMDHMPNHGPRHAPRVNEPGNESGNDMPAPLDKPAKPNNPIPPPEGLRWYWTMYNIPATESGVIAGHNVGSVGTNVVNNHNEYAPPCSKGPGPKTYTIHLYALSDSIAITSPEKVTESTLRNAMEGLILDTDSISASFERVRHEPTPTAR
jgi:phosphatidylethanolamine-binding protein (PEBP) family uncharacterized protein